MSDDAIYVISVPRAFSDRAADDLLAKFKEKFPDKRAIVLGNDVHIYRVPSTESKPE